MTPQPASPDGNPTIAVVDLRCQVPPGVLAAASGDVRLTWQVAPAVADVQLAWQAQASAAPGFEVILADSGTVQGADQVSLPAPGPSLASREVRWYRVRVRTSLGWAAWGPALRVEAGLLAPTDWTALAVTLPNDPGSERQAPPPVLRRMFELPADVARARLYVTSLGLHKVSLNGVTVTDDLLAPGWTSYRHRLLAETYDVTALLRAGSNVIVGSVGDGWFRGRLGWDPTNDRGKYGAQVALVAQLEVELRDGTSQRIVTDGSWQAATGEVLLADSTTAV